MTEQAVDHRRATAQRNAAAILDATEHLLAQRTRLSMVAIAAEAGVSRPTLYAHYKSIAEIVEAAVERSVVASLAALARGAAEHLPSGAVHRSHDAMLAPLRAVVDRGRRAGVFRTDVPVDWLLSMYFALVHGADEHAASQAADRAGALQLLTTSLMDLFSARPQASTDGAP